MGTRAAGHVLFGEPERGTREETAKTYPEEMLRLMPGQA